MHRRQTKTKWWALCLLAFLSMATPLLPYLRGNASAITDGATTLNYVNYNEIDVSNTYPSDFRQIDKQQGKFTLDKSEQHDCGVVGVCNDLYYTQRGSGDGTTTGNCFAQIKVEAKNDTGIAYKSKVHLSYAEHDAKGGSCSTKNIDITPQNYEAGHTLLFNWIDKNRIDPVGPLPEVDPSTKNGNVLVKYGSFTLAPDGTYADTGDSYRCKSYLDNISSDRSSADLHLWNQGGSGSCSDDYKDKMRISMGDTANASATPDPTKAPIVNTGSTGSGGAESSNCENKAGPLGWISCKIIDLFAAGIDGIYDNVITPLVETKPLNISANTVNSKGENTNPNLVAWSSFRVIGDILLVIALLVIVFGQSIGGGLIDAYAVKKILPRILITAILINLSFYIVAFLVDITNIIGHGITNLLLTPFKAAGEGIKVGPGSATFGLAAFVTGAFAGAATIGIWFSLFMLNFVLPAALIMVGILVILILRQGLILFLVIVAPVAFALYCLPNTEQYFKKWWELLFKTLLMYPIIAVLFALSKVFSIVLTQTDSAGGPLKVVLAIIVPFVPLLLIPFAFKLAGGVLGRLNDLATNGSKRASEAVKGNPNDQRSLRNRLRYNARSKYNDRRGETFDKLASRTTAGNGRIKKGVYGAVARGVGYGNLEADRAQMNEEQEKIIAAQYSTGGDNSVRAYWAKQYKGTAAEGDADGRQVGAYYSPYQNADGTYKEWSKADVQKANRIVGNDPSRVQSYAKYEMNKAADDGQLGAFQQRFLDKGAENGYTASQMNKIWGGDKFALQQTRKELKHTNVEEELDNNGKKTGKFKFGAVNDNTFSTEMVDSVRRGDMSGFRSSTGAAAIDSYTKLANKGVRTPAEEQAFQNWQQLGKHMDENVFSPQGAQPRAAAEGQSGDEHADASGGYGFGGSVKAEEQWKEFSKLTTGKSGRPPARGEPAPSALPPPPEQRPPGEDAGYM